jgi:hypothetical protein
MAIPLEGSIVARREAPLHVQIRLTKRPDAVPDRNGGEVAIEGEVVNVFRGQGLAAPGSLITFQLWVCRAGAEPTDRAFAYEDALAQASHLEAFLYGRPPTCRLAAYEFELLDGPTPEPTLTVEELERLRWGM